MKHSDFYLSARDITTIIQTELFHHPKLELIDIYKLIYQAYFGPNHITRNSEQLTEGIINEVNTMQHSYLPLHQDIGNKQGYWRFSLSWLAPHKGKDTLNEKAALLAELMLQSCSSDTITLSPSERWNLTKPSVAELFKATEAQWQSVDAIAKEELIPSHSQLFSQTYHPHYRVIHPCASENLLHLMQ